VLGRTWASGAHIKMIYDRVMTNISCQRLHGGDTGEARAPAHRAPIQTTSP
jgi:hypothetical protein